MKTTDNVNIKSYFAFTPGWIQEAVEKPGRNPFYQ